jgi:hypothetical protein
MLDVDVVRNVVDSVLLVQKMREVCSNYLSVSNDIQNSSYCNMSVDTVAIR